ncbi:cupin domain-containing protein [Pseudomonas sp. S11A4]|uniref:cupin domain-containing protein n=1 Tax=Pseudomonas sp. S11A4 TaxID=1476791 RepID=UPI00406C888D
MIGSQSRRINAGKAQFFVQITQRRTIVDVLTQVLDAVRLSGTLTFCGDFAAPWGFEKAALSGVPFHIVQAGEAWLHCAGIDARRLEVGDSVFFQPVPHTASQVDE